MWIFRNESHQSYRFSRIGRLVRLRNASGGLFQKQPDCTFGNFSLFLRSKSAGKSLKITEQDRRYCEVRKADFGYQKRFQQGIF